MQRFLKLFEPYLQWFYRCFDLQRQIRAGRASNKSEVIHQALALLDAVTRGQGPVGATFRNADELEALLLQAGPATPMTAERKARIYGRLKR